MKRLLQGAIFALMGILLASSLSLTGCGSSEESTEQSPESTAMDSVKTENQRLQTENAQLTKSNAQLEQDKKALNAKVADLTSKLGQSSQQWQDLVDLQNKVSALDSQLTIQKQVNRDLMARNADMNKEEMVGGAMMTTVTTKSDYQTKYDDALAAFKARKYKDAVADLQNLAASSADSALASNAHYWLGESFYALRKYSDAAREFQTTLTFKKSFKRGAAYLMLGMTYVRLGDKDKAKSTWEELINMDPKSQYAARAKDFLNQL